MTLHSAPFGPSRPACSPLEAGWRGPLLPVTPAPAGCFGPFRKGHTLGDAALPAVNGDEDQLAVGGVADRGTWVGGGAELAFVDRELTVGDDLVTAGDGVIQRHTLAWAGDVVGVVLTTDDGDAIVRIDVDGGPVAAKGRDLLAVGSSPAARVERPGGPGSLPTQGSHRSVRARTSAYGSSAHGFAVATVLSVSGSLTRWPNVEAFVVFLKNGSVTRFPAFLHWLRPHHRSPASTVLSGTMTSCRPSHLASFPSLGGTSVVLDVFAPRRPSTTVEARSW